MPIIHRHIILFFLVFAPLFGFNQSLGDGSSGSPNISGVVNDYTYLLTDAFSCDAVLHVKDESIFNPNDLILVVQMQGTEIDPTNTATYGTVLSLSTCGNFEYSKVDHVIGNDVYLSYPLVRNYSAAGNTQVIRVPQYDSPVVTGTLLCKTWNGKTGGILAIDVLGTLKLNADINAIGSGFRGGEVMTGNHIMFLAYDYIAEYPDPTWYAAKGEGIAGYGYYPYISARGAPANAGGGGNIHTTGGGGGANGGTGGDGGWGYPVDTSGGEQLVFGIGGYSIDYNATVNRFFLGGGGGAGHAHFGNGTSGSNGGGVVIISANQIEGNNHTIYANGNGSGSSGAYGDGAGGAGAGGGIVIHSPVVLSDLYCNVSGGNGGSTVMDGFGPGGGGSGGVVFFSTPSTPANIAGITSVGGVGGLAGGSYYGAKNGTAGITLYNFELPINNYAIPVIADFSYSETDNQIFAFFNQSTGADIWNWDMGDGTFDTTFNPIHTFTEPGIYTVTLTAINDSSCNDTHTEIIITPIPNVFTPNNDGINDDFLFSYQDSEFYIVTLLIYNRWGQLMNLHSSLSWDGMADGNPAPSGIYYYTLEITLTSGEVIKKSGYLSLLR